MTEFIVKRVLQGLLVLAVMTVPGPINAAVTSRPGPGRQRFKAFGGSLAVMAGRPLR